MIDLRPVLVIIGFLLVLLAASMLLPMVVDLQSGHSDWQAFLAAAAITFSVGASLFLANQGASARLTMRQAFVLTTLIWVVVSAFAALPLVFSEVALSYTDALFEAMSGLTTTGSTVLSGLDTAPLGILLWRALLQWLGGIGILVMALSVLPVLQVGGMQMFKAEAFDTPDKVVPRAAQLAGGLATVYIALTTLWWLAFWNAGMTSFEALIHAMTTLSTGGYSTSDMSIGHFNSATVDYIAVLGMLIGSLPFVIYLQGLRGDFTGVFRDDQARGFLLVVAVLVALMALWLWLSQDMAPAQAVRYAAFNISTVITGTGFSNADFNHWGPLVQIGLLFLMMTGGCAGSTSCGIKIFRFQVLFATSSCSLARLLQPHGVFIPYFNGRPIPEEVSVSVMSFFFLFVVTFAVISMSLGALGLDFVTAVSGTATAMGNVGPGLGPEIGPSGNFAALPDAAKWILTFGMLLGRLELFTVLVLLAPNFWRG